MLPRSNLQRVTSGFTIQCWKTRLMSGFTIQCWKPRLMCLCLFSHENLIWILPLDLLFVKMVFQKLPKFMCWDLDSVLCIVIGSGLNLVFAVRTILYRFFCRLVVAPGVFFSFDYIMQWTRLMNLLGLLFGCVPCRGFSVQEWKKVPVISNGSDWWIP